MCEKKITQNGINSSLDMQEKKSKCGHIAIEVKQNERDKKRTMTIKQNISELCKIIKGPHTYVREMPRGRGKGEMEKKMLKW